MTAEQNDPENDVIDKLAGNWFDSEPGDSEFIESADGICASFDTKQIRRVAELQLVHSLLLQLSDRDEVAKERQVQKLMEHIKTSPDGQETMPEKLHRFIRPLVRYGIAAVLIISIAILFMQLPTNTAIAAIDQMIAAIDHAGDRTYSIIVEDTRRDNRPPRQDERHAEKRREPGERAGLDGATLYLRGSDKFVLYQQTPSGKTVISGSDGQTRWLIRPEKPVLVSNDPEAFRIPMPPELAAILSLDLKATLLHIRDHYKVKYLEDITGDQQQDSSRKYLDARKISNDFPGPKNIEIWADTDTGLLLRIEFADIHLEDDPSPKRLIIELVNQKQLSDDWFTRQAHHPPEAEVDFVSE